MHYAICDYLTDIVQNSVEAKASLIFVEFNEDDQVIEVSVSDNGSGMDAETLARAIDPFYSSKTALRKRKVGLGLPFLAQATKASGGDFEIKSEPELGTSVYCSFDRTNIDVPPIGNLVSCFLALFGFEPNSYDLVIKHSIKSSSYTLTKSELEVQLGSLSSVEALWGLKKQITNFEKQISDGGK